MDPRVECLIILIISSGLFLPSNNVKISIKLVSHFLASAKVNMYLLQKTAFSLVQSKLALGSRGYLFVRYHA